jgi:Obg family GTPase CgtA
VTLFFRIIKKKEDFSMFADRAKIFIRSGKGGDGHVSFRRELYVPNGGPDGGDGGRGGDVIFEVDKGLNTLQDFRHKRKFAAKDGEPGGKRRCHGADADDIVLKVPEGTVIKEAESDKVIADMSGENRRQVVLKGGRGGLGNQHFATATMQIPKYAQPGQPAQELWIKLELKVIADVGLIGFPNVGKSTFLSRVTNAQPKIANYHFTTLNPNLGVVDLGEAKGFVIADIPGLIEGASEGVGLGHEFLRHIERTKMMIHVVDAAGSEGRDPVEDVYKINQELEAYNPDIASRPQVIAANKTDLIYEGDESPVDRLKKEFEPKGIKVFPISGVSGQGMKELLYYVSGQLSELDQEPVIFEQEYFPEDELIYIDLPFTVEKDKDAYVVEGPKIEKMLGYTNLDSEKGFAFFQKFLKDTGILEELEAAGIQEGDTVRMYGLQFDYYK